MQEIFQKFLYKILKNFDVICDNNEDFFLKTYLRFVMMLEHVNDDARTC